MGKVPSVFLAERIGRLSEGWDAIETKRSGIDNNLKPKLLRYAKEENRTAAIKPIKDYILKPIFLSAPDYIFGNETRARNHQIKRVFLNENYRLLYVKVTKNNQPY